jgi:hypothetical protein
VSLLLMVAGIALAAMFVLHSLELVADNAHELHRQALARQGQAIQHTNIAACERASMCAAVLLLSSSLCGN